MRGATVYTELNSGKWSCGTFPKDIVYPDKWFNFPCTSNDPSKAIHVEHPSNKLAICGIKVFGYQSTVNPAIKGSNAGAGTYPEPLLGVAIDVDVNGAPYIV